MPLDHKQRPGKGIVSIARRSLVLASLSGGIVRGVRASPVRADSQPRHEADMETTPSPGTPAASSAVLLVSFSRAGENYVYGGRTNLVVGNTDVLATMIGEQVVCDTYRIEATDPYSDDYDATVERNVREQDADARPAIAHPLDSIDQYDTILLGSPIWNVRPPRIMLTFAESFDFTGKRVYPFTTQAMSGLGSAMDDYADAFPGAVIGDGLAVRGEEVLDAAPAVDSWLRRIGLR